MMRKRYNFDNSLDTFRVRAHVLPYINNVAVNTISETRSTFLRINVYVYTFISVVDSIYD